MGYEIFSLYKPTIKMRAAVKPAKHDFNYRSSKKKCVMKGNEVKKNDFCCTAIQRPLNI